MALFPISVTLPGEQPVGEGVQLHHGAVSQGDLGNIRLVHFHDGFHHGEVADGEDQASRRCSWSR